MDGINKEDQEVINYISKKLSKKDQVIFAGIIKKLAKDPLDAFNQEITDMEKFNDYFLQIDTQEVLISLPGDTDIKRLCDSLPEQIGFTSNINFEQVSFEELSAILAESTILSTTDHAGMRVNAIQHPTLGKVTTVQGDDGGLLLFRRREDYTII